MPNKRKYRKTGNKCKNQPSLPPAPETVHPTPQPAVTGNDGVRRQRLQSRFVEDFSDQSAYPVDLAQSSERKSTPADNNYDDTTAVSSFVTKPGRLDYRQNNTPSPAHLYKEPYSCYVEDVVDDAGDIAETRGPQNHLSAPKLDISAQPTVCRKARFSDRIEFIPKDCHLPNEGNIDHGEQPQPASPLPESSRGRRVGKKRDTYAKIFKSRQELRSLLSEVRFNRLVHDQALTTYARSDSGSSESTNGMQDLVKQTRKAILEVETYEKKCTELISEISHYLTEARWATDGVNDYHAGTVSGTDEFRTAAERETGRTYSYPDGLRGKNTVQPKIAAMAGLIPDMDQDGTGASGAEEGAANSTRKTITSRMIRRSVRKSTLILSQIKATQVSNAHPTENEVTQAIKAALLLATDRPAPLVTRYRHNLHSQLLVTHLSLKSNTLIALLVEKKMLRRHTDLTAYDSDSRVAQAMHQLLGSDIRTSWRPMVVVANEVEQVYREMGVALPPAVWEAIQTIYAAKTQFSDQSVADVIDDCAYASWWIGYRDKFSARAVTRLINHCKQQAAAQRTTRGLITRDNAREIQDAGAWAELRKTGLARGECGLASARAWLLACRVQTRPPVDTHAHWHTAARNRWNAYDFSRTAVGRALVVDLGESFYRLKHLVELATTECSRRAYTETARAKRHSYRWWSKPGQTSEEYRLAMRRFWRVTSDPRAMTLLLQFMRMLHDIGMGITGHDQVSSVSGDDAVDVGQDGDDGDDAKDRQEREEGEGEEEHGTEVGGHLPMLLQLFLSRILIEWSSDTSRLVAWLESVRGEPRVKTQVAKSPVAQRDASLVGCGRRLCEEHREPVKRDIHLSTRND